LHYSSYITEEGTKNLIKLKYKKFVY